MYNFFNEYVCPDCGEKTYNMLVLQKKMQCCPLCGSNKELEFNGRLFYKEEGKFKQDKEDYK